jgi:transcriptional regulator with XRE-family HTH domain
VELGVVTDFAVLLREAVAARGLSLAALAAELRSAGAPCGVSSLSEWQSGRGRPERATSLRALDALEGILGVPAGHLRSALPTRARRGRSRALPTPVAPWTGPPELVPLLARLDATTDDLAGPLNEPVSRRLHLSLDEHGDLASLSMATLVRARRDGTTRIIDAGYDEEPDAAPRIVAARGARVGRFVHDPESRLSACELLLPRPLAAGEVALLEYTEYFAQHAHACEITLRATPETRDLVVRVEFHPDRVPTGTRGFHRADQREEETPRRVQRSAGPVLQMVVADPEPGFHGIGWSWDRH